MDVSKPALNMLQTWTETQQKVWAGWLDTMQGIGRTPTPDLRGKIIDTWEQSVNYTLETQADLMSSWIESVGKAEGAPDTIKDWVAQSEDTLQKWQNAQRELWTKLFNVLRAAEPGTSALSLQRQGMEIFRAWQDSARQTMSATLGAAADTVTAGRGQSTPKR